MGPYRQAPAADVTEARTRDGLVRLEVSPHQVSLQVGDRLRLEVQERRVSLHKLQRRRPKTRSIVLGAQHRLLMARAQPTDDIGIWYQSHNDIVERLIGMRPYELLDEDAVAAWKTLERLSKQLRDAMAPYSRGVTGALEVGRGADRVLVLQYGRTLVLYVRRLFRERARRAMEVRPDGTIDIINARRSHGIHCTSRYGVTVLGDYIRFADPTGSDLGTLSVPWVSPEDRQFLVDLIGDTIDPSGTAPKFVRG